MIFSLIPLDWLVGQGAFFMVSLLALASIEWGVGGNVGVSIGVWVSMQDTIVGASV